MHSRVCACRAGYTHAASKHTTAPINHTRPSPRKHSPDVATRSKHPITACYSIYRPRKDERLSWPSWLTCSGRFTRISGHPSAAGRAQDRKSSPVTDRRLPLPRHQIVVVLVIIIIIIIIINNKWSKNFDENAATHVVQLSRIK